MTSISGENLQPETARDRATLDTENRYRPSRSSIEVPAPRRGRGFRIMRVLALAGAPLAALAAVWYVTRGDQPTAQPAAHDHATMGMSGGSAGDSVRPVALSAADQRRIGVTFAPVTSGALGREVRTVGHVTVDETRVQTFAPKIDGWVERLHVDYTGQAIQRGAPLLTIYSPMLVTAQEELLLALKLTRDVAGASSATRDGATDLVASARRRLAWWDIPAEEIARVERTGEVQRTLTLRAPASGIVLEKNVTAGQRVMAGDVLYRIADLTRVWVEGEVYEQDVRALRVGQSVAAEFDALPGEHRVGRIAFVYPTLTPETRTARVRIEIANPGLRLKHGMYATLLVEGAAARPTLSVPRGAVLATGERQIVFLRRGDGQLEPRQVETGGTTDDRIEILRGLALGDTVVASATFLIDAESNLGTALGGMGDMPGMEITMPPGTGPDSARPRAPLPAVQPPGRGVTPAASPAQPAAKPAAPPNPHAGHEER